MADMSHLVERAAERLRTSGAVDPSAAGLLGPAAAGPPARPRVIGPVEPATGHHDSVDRAPLDAGAADTGPTITMENLWAAGLSKGGRTRSRLSEELRLVQSHILRAAFTPEPGQPGPGLGNLVMVTSARPAEGKSFTALNLAASIAGQRDRDVVLIDADGKHGSMGERLGLRDAPGLLDFALDPTLDLATLLVPTALPALSFLPIGRPVERSAEVFSSRQMPRAIREIGRRFADRVVILDTAPCLSTSDPSLLAPLIGQVLMLVEAERTQRPEVEAALDLVQACPTIVMLLNKMQTRQRNSFGGYARASAYAS